MVTKTYAVTTSVSEEDFQEAMDNYVGWCPECEDFTRDATEPDAEDYNCEVCDNNHVMGAEQALLLGLIKISS